MLPSLVAWDFDGVLNRNFEGGKLVWHRDFEADLGVSAKSFERFMFRSGRFNEVLTGKRDVLDLLGQWIAAFKVLHNAPAVLDYWLDKDAHRDNEVLGWVRASGIRSVIATNNEARRADYIWHHMGYGAEMEHIFASGPMGVRKPEPGFFSHIEEWSGVAPA